MIQIIKDNDNFFDIYTQKKLPVVLWGIGEWGRLFADISQFEISDICDVDESKQGELINGKEVISPNELETKYRGKEFYIINSYGTTRGLQAGLYIMACRYAFNAMLVNLHTNIGFDLNVKEFLFDGKTVELKPHLHNCGYLNERMSERAIEVAMAQEWLMNYEDVIEIGAVTPYYFPGQVKEVVDPADEHYLVSTHKSVFDVDLNNRNVLCLSTVEHIGTGQYGVTEVKNAEMAIEKILNESKHCLITTPVGENPIVDNYLRKHLNDDNLVVYLRPFYGNKWKIIDKQEVDIEKTIEYCKKIATVYNARNLIGGNCGNIVITK